MTPNDASARLVYDIFMSKASPSVLPQSWEKTPTATPHGAPPKGLGRRVADLMQELTLWRIEPSHIISWRTTSRKTDSPYLVDVTRLVVLAMRVESSKA
jgi:hypothetical protein